MKTFFLICFCLAVASPALAATPDKFSPMDADNDGAVTWEEFHKTYPQMRQGAFDAIDADKNKAISRQEWETFSVQHGQGQSGMGMHPAAPDTSEKKPLILPPKQ